MKREKLSGVRSRVGVVSLSVITLSFLLGYGHWDIFALSQPGPWLVRLSAGFAVSAVVFLCFFALFAFLFGRFFCAGLCPLGALQDIAGKWCKNKKTSVANLRFLRYAIAAISILLLISGWTLVFRLFDPFSRFGGILSGVVGVLQNGAETRSYMIGGLLPLLALVVLVRWKKRLYCTAVCPVGTILGLFAKHGVWRMRITGSCTGCGLCEKSCPAGCVESKTHSIDNERCVRCMSCFSLCPTGGISLSRADFHEASVEVPVNRARREFLIKGTVALLGTVTAGHMLGGPIRSFARRGQNAEGLILPPGAMDSEDFLLMCTGCHFCALNCPSRVIKPSRHAFGPVRLNYGNGACLYGCTRCNQVCPSGALKPLSLKDKQRLKIGEAVLDESKCMVFRDKKACELCAQACPKGTVYMLGGPDNLKIPEVNAFHCIGCGACQRVCPMKPKAITIMGINQGKFAGIS